MTPWLHEDGVQIFLIYVGPNMFSGDVRKIYENYHFGSCTIYFHQASGFFDTNPCECSTFCWGNYCPCAALQSLWLRCWGGCNRSCRHGSLLSCPTGNCNCFFVSSHAQICLFLLRENNIWTNKTRTLHWNSCIVPEVLRVKRIAIQ